MRVGLLGIGRVGQIVLQASAQVPGVSIVAAFDVDSDKTASLPSSIKVTQSAQELLADPDIDVVYVATPTNLHYHHAKLVASYGKDLLLEKPAAEELSEYTAIKKLALKSKINAVVAFHALFGSEVNWFRSEYLSGTIVDLPKIKSVTAQFFDPYVLNGRLLPQAFSLQNSLMDSGPNALSIFFSLFPDCRVEKNSESKSQNSDKTSGESVKGNCEFSICDPRFGEFEYSLQTDWNKGTDSKQTIIEFENGTTIILNHNLRSVERIDGSITSILYKSDSKIERIEEHYMQLLDDAKRKFSAGNSNWNLSDRVHMALLPSKSLKGEEKMEQIERTISLWSSQDDLLQSYRSIFLTTISIFAAISIALSISKEHWHIVIFASVLGLYTNALWINLTWERGQSVFYLQTLLRRFEREELAGNQVANKDGVFTKLRRFQDDEEFAKSEYEADDFIRPDPARSGLNFGLPCLFLLFWVVLSGSAAYDAVNDLMWGMPLAELMWASLSLAAIWFLVKFSYLALYRKSYSIRLRFWPSVFISFVIAFALWLISTQLNAF